ncbi:ion transport protein [Piromyces finnis]|uniref:Ion transport protein n=1 Tax=Piromyces finnis TaxID=1754191 RepID=A0A1Y1UWA1_9FUNG|nr:ion transport protein [Piromyces finnis]|eukprot:ORX42316.1 ion transport protein [Piromyces finnis]
MRFRKRLFEIIEVAEPEDKPSLFYDIFIIITIVISIIPLAFKETCKFFEYSDIIVAIIFVIDYILRLITADYKLKKEKTYLSFILYPFTFWAIIDLFSILPSLSILYDGLKLLRVLNLIKTLRVIRAIKLFRYSNSTTIIFDVISNSKTPLSAVCTLAIGYILVSALIIFNVENDTFDTFFSAVYWATVSLTTVGYGDLYPVTTEGRMIAMVSSLFGIALVALPAGIITAGYMDSLNKIIEEKIESKNKLNEKSKSKSEYDTNKEKYIVKNNFKFLLISMEY